MQQLNHLNEKLKQSNTLLQDARFVTSLSQSSMTAEELGYDHRHVQQRVDENRQAMEQFDREHKLNEMLSETNQKDKEQSQSMQQMVDYYIEEITAQKPEAVQAAAAVVSPKQTKVEPVLQEALLMR